jgi:hypothetical protein
MKMQCYAMQIKSRCVACLLDLDASVLWNRGLGDIDAEDTVFQRCLDGVLVDSDVEAEAAAEFADLTFRDPVLWLVSGLGWLGVLRRRDFRRLRFCRCVFVFDSGLVGLYTFAFGCWGRDAVLNSGLLLSLDGAIRLGMALRAAFDGERVFIDELDGDVLLVNASDFGFYRIGVFGFLDVEAGIECRPDLSRGAVEFVQGVVKETEEGCELIAGWSATSGNICHTGEEEGHVSGLRQGLRDSVDVRSDSRG